MEMMTAAALTDESELQGMQVRTGKDAAESEAADAADTTETPDS
jgi:hypothetical protein